jgi:hypothetical protein
VNIRDEVKFNFHFRTHNLSFQWSNRKALHEVDRVGESSFAGVGI